MKKERQNKPFSYNGNCIVTLAPLFFVELSSRSLSLIHISIRPVQASGLHFPLGSDLREILLCDTSLSLLPQLSPNTARSVFPLQVHLLLSMLQITFVARQLPLPLLF